ncbi:AT-hook motif nuclear-localized protein 18-like [Zingiber officinale]|uniref:AT-hook motif nuclear-localized protein 18-like n=1 Tax=Zingiber officinale TaxID=94328 RepID=UPI001C4AFF7D|nr:AT-hook motif nuclear-localized protein 18-like [Zingiber officinale]
MDRLPPSHLARVSNDQRLQQSNVDEEVKNTNNSSNEGSSSGGGEAGVQSQRKRGRPPGSRNKPKPPVVITRDSAHAVRAHVMEVAAGHDIVESVAEFARRRQVGVSLISGRGTVSDVTVSGPAGVVMPLRGRFDIVSLSGLVLPSSSLPAASWLTVYLGSVQGQLVGGSVVGPMVAATPVMIMASSFGNAAYERLPLMPEEPPDQDIRPLQGPSPALPPVPQQLVGGANNPPPFHGHLPQLLSLINNTNTTTTTTANQNILPSPTDDEFRSWGKAQNH